MTVASDNKGELLYQEALSRRSQILLGLAFATAFLVLAVFFARAVLEGWGRFSGMPQVLQVLTLVVSVMFVILSATLVVVPFKTMPFRVYERGVTLTRVPLRDGLAGREVFVPAGEIARVTYEATYVPKVGSVDFFRFHRLDGNHFNVRVDDPERVTGLLMRVLRCEVEGPVRDQE